VSAFHRHFKTVTNLSPLQYQKRVRLLKAGCAQNPWASQSDSWRLNGIPQLAFIGRVALLK
jgi:hypothetical protein